MKKTNAIRELEIHKIEHIVREYEVDEDYEKDEKERE